MAKKLNEKQYAAIALLTDFGHTLTYEEVAQRIDVSPSTLRRWRTQDEAFINEIISQSKRNAVADLPRVMNAIPDIIINSENAAMLRTWLQTIGALTDKVEVTTNATNNGDVDAIKAEIERMRAGQSKE